MNFHQRLCGICRHRQRSFLQSPSWTRWTDSRVSRLEATATRSSSRLCTRSSRIWYWQVYMDGISFDEHRDYDCRKSRLVQDQSLWSSRSNQLVLLGDVQPYIALSQRLQKDGHRIRIASHETFRSFVNDAGLEFFDIGGNPQELMSYMVKSLSYSTETLRNVLQRVHRPRTNAWLWVVNERGHWEEEKDAFDCTYMSLRCRHCLPNSR